MLDTDKVTEFEVIEPGKGLGEEDRNSFVERNKEFSYLT